MIYKLWQKYKHYRKLQKARYLRFKCNNIFWVKIDIETICKTKNFIKYGTCTLEDYIFYKFCPLLNILYKTKGIFKEVNFYFEDERYKTSQEARDNAKIKMLGLLQQIQNYIELKQNDI